MSKFHKKNKTKKRKRRTTDTQNVMDTKNEVRERLLKSIKLDQDIKILDTPFGEILIDDTMLITTLINRNILLELLKFESEVEEDDFLGRLTYLENLKIQYPNEPFVAHEISICHEDMKEQEKYEQTVKENYEKHQGYPFIDISYVSLNLDRYNADILDNIFGRALNIHQVYPMFKAFDSKVVAEFYATLSAIYKSRNELLLARQCAEIVTQFNEIKGLLLETELDYIEKPWFKWKSWFIVMIIILVVIGVISGIIWGIISLFQWIF